jgi:hypothetical protein
MLRKGFQKGPGLHQQRRGKTRVRNNISAGLPPEQFRCWNLFPFLISFRRIKQNQNILSIKNDQDTQIIGHR